MTGDDFRDVDTVGYADVSQQANAAGWLLDLPLRLLARWSCGRPNRARRTMAALAAGYEKATADLARRLRG